MRLPGAQHLLPKAFRVHTLRVRRGSGIVAVIDQICNSQRVMLRQDLIESRCAKLLTNLLLRVAEGLRDSIPQFRAVRDRP